MRWKRHRKAVEKASRQISSEASFRRHTCVTAATFRYCEDELRREGVLRSSRIVLIQKHCMPCYLQQIESGNESLLSPFRRVRRSRVLAASPFRRNTEASLQLTAKFLFTLECAVHYSAFR